MNFIDPLRNMKGINGETIIIDKRKPTYVLAVRAPDKMGGFYSQRMATQSYDSLRNLVLNKLKDTDIYYIATRRGKKMKDVKAIAVYSEKLGGVACPRELALKRIALL